MTGETRHGRIDPLQPGAVFLFLARLDSGRHHEAGNWSWPTGNDVPPFLAVEKRLALRQKGARPSRFGTARYGGASLPISQTSDFRPPRCQPGVQAWQGRKEAPGLKQINTAMARFPVISAIEELPPIAGIQEDWVVFRGAVNSAVVRVRGAQALSRRGRQSLERIPGVETFSGAFPGWFGTRAAG